MRLASLLLLLLIAPEASAKKPQPGLPKPLKEIEAQAKALSKGKDPAAAFDGFMKWLGLSSTCEANACKTIAEAKWLTANLDADAEDEKVLAIVTHGDGPCKSASLEVIVFEAFDKDWVAKDRTRILHAGATSPKLEVTATNVHHDKIKDLVLHADGQCTGGAREQVVRVESFEHGQLESLADSSDYVSTGLVSYALHAPSAGALPSPIELTDAKGKTKLGFDELAFVYDALPPYETALKASTSKDDDATLSVKECAAPLGGDVAAACHLAGDAKLQIAVQNGKAIGLTITMTPPKSSFAHCMRKKVAAASWPSQPGVTGCVRTFSAK
ncbi:MAG: hypothetical protein ACXVEE_14635 [Polyangiales bacterium]